MAIFDSEIALVSNRRRCYLYFKSHTQRFFAISYPTRWSRDTDRKKWMGNDAISVGVPSPHYIAQGKLLSF